MPVTASLNISASGGFVGNLIGTSSFAAAVAPDSITVGMMKANSVDSDQYVDDSIDTAHYAAGSVDATALASNAVTNAKMADNAVDTAEIAASAVETAKINDDAVTTGKIADDAVTYAKMQHTSTSNRLLGASSAGAIGEVQVNGNMMGANSVDSAQYVNGSIDTEHYAAGSVDATALASNAVTNAKMADNAVDTAEIAASAVETAKINDAAVTTAKINDAAVTTAKINDDAVTGAKIENNPTIAGNLTVNGNTTLGNASTDTTTIKGNITASGATLSMSSAAYIQTPEIRGAGAGITQLDVAGEITASGNISSSATITANLMQTPRINAIGGSLYIANSMNVAGGQITAAGNISSSAYVYSQNIETFWTSFNCQGDSSFGSSAYGPNTHGINYYHWNKNWSSIVGDGGDPTGDHVHRSEINSGWYVPYKIRVVGFSGGLTDGSANSTTTCVVKLFNTVASLASSNYDSNTGTTKALVASSGNVTLNGNRWKHYNITGLSVDLAEGQYVLPRITMGEDLNNLRGQFTIKYHRIA